MGNKVKTFKPNADFDPEDFEPIVLRPKKEDDETVLLFTIEETGDDGEPTGSVVEYHALKRVPFNVSLKAMKIMVENGEMAAIAYSLQTLLGVEGFNALMNLEGLEREDFGKIMDYANKVVIQPGKSPSNRQERRFAIRHGSPDA